MARKGCATLTKANPGLGAKLMLVCTLLRILSNADPNACVWLTTEQGQYELGEVGIGHADPIGETANPYVRLNALGGAMVFDDECWPTEVMYLTGDDWSA